MTPLIGSDSAKNYKNTLKSVMVTFHLNVLSVLPDFIDHAFYICSKVAHQVLIWSVHFSWASTCMCNMDSVMVLLPGLNQ